MKRVCILGDSHIAALKSGWPSIEGEFADTTITFFGAAAYRMKDLVVENGALVATSKGLKHLFKMTSGTDEDVRGDFDSYILCGLGTGIPAVAPVIKGYRAERAAKDTRVPVSDDCYRMSLAGCLRKTRMMGVLAKLMQISSARIGLVAAPMPSTAIVRSFIEVLKRNGDDLRVAQLLRSAFDDITEGTNARLLPQPEKTLGDSKLATGPAYFRGAARLFDNLDDQVHANAEYGAIVLREALHAL